MSNPQLDTAHKALLERYEAICEANDDGSEIDTETHLGHLQWMCRNAKNNIPYWPADKISRWLGYVQGVLTCKGLVNVKDERDLSRLLFHAAYDRPPATIERDR